MVQMIASTFVADGSLWLYVDSKIIMKGSDSATVELNEGEEYIVHWFVEAAPGKSYSITISSPREAEFQLTRTLMPSGKDQGSFRFIA
jgi:hypothetical protein